MDHEQQSRPKGPGTADLLAELRQASAPARDALNAIANDSTTSGEVRVRALQAIGELDIRCSATARDLYIQLLTRPVVKLRSPEESRG